MGRTFIRTENEEIIKRLMIVKPGGKRKKVDHE
jgi:hypothetical protein